MAVLNSYKHFCWLQQLYQSLHHLCRDLRRVLLSTVAHAILSRHAMREKQPEDERLSEGSPEGETFDRSTARGRQIATREPQKDVSRDERDVSLLADSQVANGKQRVFSHIK